MAARVFDGEAGADAEFAESVAHGRWEHAEQLFDGSARAASESFATLIERIVKGIDRPGTVWTSARRKEGIQRLVAAGRTDSRRLQQRLAQLLGSWEEDSARAEAALDDPRSASSTGSAFASLTNRAPLAASGFVELAEHDKASGIDTFGEHAPAGDAAAADGSSPGPATTGDGHVAAASPGAASARASDDITLPAERAAPEAEAPTRGAAPTVTREPSVISDLDDAAAATAAPPPGPATEAWSQVVAVLQRTISEALPTLGEGDHELTLEVAELARRLDADGATHALAAELEALTQRVARVLQHRHHLFEQLGKLCRELTASLSEVAENDSWVRGQCEAMRAAIADGLTARGVSAVSDILQQARKRHAEMRGEREGARDALKVLITKMLGELDELGAQTGSFNESVGRYASVIEQSDSLESLTGVVREMVEESRAVHSLVQQTRDRLQAEHRKASGLSQRVSELEDAMKRLSDEVSTDQLTQIANRRGLMQAFEVERARIEREGGTLSIGLLDIDNFKRLNDELGHTAGDDALKALARLVDESLRPVDHVARYGGEEFVVLLPATPVDEGERVLTRLQRSLTGGLFMHKERQVFVTFSAGVTAYRPDEGIEKSLERADQALYEAKRTGKNRTCIG
ncbi:diguanylate cyclase [Schlegelella sp. ID0723]|uniref:diguanylate cyclase n=2 Tax=Piscinibacter koreensis TaxID=2742824 RepID=A0A7Y6NP60_9BURK|nr:GGDEF domain-containing protein [Schlegelella koreensis]NUZ06808.1 diguanylate cyclase [Schlegelella koreensis]